MDQEGNRVGTIDAVWQDHTGQPAYLAVRTGWLGLGRAHVIPAQSAEVSDATRRIRVPYSTDFIKNAPSFDCQADVTREAEREIRGYYGLQERGPAQEEARVQLKEEQVTVGKREVEYGGIRLRKIVRTETVSQPVQLKREEVVVERVPVHERGSAAGTEFAEQEIFIPLRKEEPVVAKEAVVREEVRVGKKAEFEHTDITEQVRKEDVEIEETTGGPEKRRAA
ncbi:MAG: PRC and DUF2382 domain-containing protein [Verrucomicrobiota bacterium]